MKHLQWISSGDGASYDISYGVLDLGLASGKYINIFVIAANICLGYKVSLICFPPYTYLWKNQSSECSVGARSMQRLVEDKAIERTMRGHYKKLVSELPII